MTFHFARREAEEQQPRIQTFDPFRCVVYGVLGGLIATVNPEALNWLLGITVALLFGPFVRAFIVDWWNGEK